MANYDTSHNRQMVKKHISSLLFKLENRFDFLKAWVRKKRKNYDPIQVLPYIGYGSEKIFRIKGRVIENKAITGASPNDTRWRNLANMYKRFESDEVEGVELKLKYGSETYYTKTDEEGYFELDFTPQTIVKGSIWQEIEIEITKAPIPYTEGIKYVQKVLHPSSQSEYGVISDMDDTIVQTHATSFLKMFATTFLNNAQSRTPFPGVPSFYEALLKGTNNSINPCFYVSSSPWNLYDLLLEFLLTHKIPAGPLLLKDYGINESSILSAGHQVHKYFQIEKILQTFQNLKFILIGDAGQEDASIYSQVIQDFPDRILAAYIRDLNIPKHRAKVLQIQEKRRDHAVPLILVKDSLTAALHALENKWITLESFQHVKEEMKNDQY